MPRYGLNQSEIDALTAQALAAGGTVMYSRQQQDVAPAPEEKKTKPKLVQARAYMRLETFVAYVPIETKSEVNQREWKAKNRRAGQAWKAVSKAIGPHLDLLAPFARAYADNWGLKITFTRLGGRKLDRGNLASACKGVEDALAFLLGADDGSPLWMPVFEQETGGEVGMRIELEARP